MKIKMVQDLAAWKDYRDLRKGEIYDLPPEDAQKLIKNGLAAEVIEEFLGDELAEKMKAEAKAPTLEPKRIVELKQGMRIKGEWWPPGRYEVPTQMPWSLSDWLLKNVPEKVEEIHVEVGKPAAQAGTEEEVQGPPPAPAEGGGPQITLDRAIELLRKEGFQVVPPAAQRAVSSYEKLVALTEYHLAEIYGAYGVGKSRFVHHIAVEAQNAGKRVLFIDTEGGLLEEHIRQLRNYWYVGDSIEALEDAVAWAKEHRNSYDVLICDSVGHPVSRKELALAWAKLRSLPRALLVLMVLFFTLFFLEFVLLDEILRRREARGGT
jgi:hypothetical protein